MQRALLCGRLCDCNHSIRGSDDELFGEVLAHLRRDHPAMLFPQERIRQFVAIRAYDAEEYALVYAEDGEGPDEEEFGPWQTSLPPLRDEMAAGRPLAAHSGDAPVLAKNALPTSCSVWRWHCRVLRRWVNKGE